MIEFGLAKELKEAGYPQEGENYWIYALAVGGWKWLEVTAVEWTESECSDWVVAPTLSELVDACGDRFSDLVRQDNSVWWVATAVSRPAPYLKQGEGDTPEEAVARLWIALQDNA